ncbi:hypothetical protein ACF0H5_006928 [Mactra antiquata]
MIGTLFKLDDTKRINNRLKDMIVSMDTISNSKETRLEALKGAKHEAIEKVEIFERALKSIIRKAAKDSKSEIVATYQELENDILKDKHKVDTVSNELQQSEGKLKKSERNRAQQFVCTKQAEKKLKEADKLKVKQDIKSNQNVVLAFTPNQSLMDHVKGLHGIGEVNVSKKNVDMYKIKEKRDVNINIPSDSGTCSSLGCCLTPDNELLVTDNGNLKLKRINLGTMTVVDYYKMFICDWKKGLTCFDGSGNYLSTSSDTDLNAAVGACVDDSGSVFVVGCNSNNAVQYNEDGQKIGVIVQQHDGLHWPTSVCFHPRMNGLFITMRDSNVVKMYELE